MKKELAKKMENGLLLLCLVIPVLVALGVHFKTMFLDIAYYYAMFITFISLGLLIIQVIIEKRRK